MNVRNKGQRGERQVVKLLQAIVDTVHQRRGLALILLQRNQLATWQGGEDITGLEGFCIEVKWQEIGWNPEWWKQCLAQAAYRPGWTPVLFYRASHQKWNVKLRAFVNTPMDTEQVESDITMSIDDFVEWFGYAYSESIDIKLQELSRWS
jgi:hypothetical protein